MIITFFDKISLKNTNKPQYTRKNLNAFNQGYNFINCSKLLIYISI